MATIPKWQKNVAIPGMLFFGTCTVVLQKLLFEQRAVGDPNRPEHKFEKPWFQTNSMFVGMCLALVVYEVQRCIQRKKKNAEDSELQSTFQSTAENPEDQTNWKMYVLLGMPAMCDLSATGLMNIGLLYINASVWQMLRGSMVLFSSLACYFFLHRKIYSYMWFAVGMVFVALLIVGIAAIASTGAGKAGATVGEVVLAICLTVGAQIIQAAQIVIEDHFMHDLTASPILIVGLEGAWGTLATLLIVTPITQFIKSEEGNGLHEDIVDTLKMIGNNPTILVFVIMYVLVILIYNVTGMFVTNITSAVVRTILEGLRTLCIWIVELILYYSLKGTKFYNTHPDIGEEWNAWSFMQLAGFLVLFTGMLIYNKIIRIPQVFDYEQTAPEEVKNDIVDDTPLIQKEEY